MSSDWEEVELGDLVAVKHGFAFKGEYFSETPTPHQLVTPGNFSIGGGFQLGKGKFYSGPVPEDYVLCRGDLLVTMTDLSKAADTLGFAARVPQTEGTIWLHNQRVGLVLRKPNVSVHLSFLHYVMRSSAYRHWVVSSATGSTVKHTSPGRICRYRFALPPLSEQFAIFQMLDAVEDRITLLRETNATLETIAQALFKSWFVDFDPVRAKMEGRAPEGMDEATATLFPETLGGWHQGVSQPKAVELIKEGVLTIGDGYRAKNSELGQPGIPFVRGGDLANGQITPTQDFLKTSSFNGAASKMAKPGDTAFTSKGTIGRFALVDDASGKAVYSPQVCFWRSLDSSVLEPVYLHFWMKSAAFLTQVDAVRGQAAIMDYVSLADQRRMRLDLPPIALQKRFASLAGAALRSISSNRAIAETLISIRDALLPRLISGQLQVGDADVLIDEEIHP